MREEIESRTELLFGPLKTMWLLPLFIKKFLVYFLCNISFAINYNCREQKKEIVNNIFHNSYQRKLSFLNNKPFWLLFRKVKNFVLTKANLGSASVDSGTFNGHCLWGYEKKKRETADSWQWPEVVVLSQAGLRKWSRISRQSLVCLVRWVAQAVCSFWVARSPQNGISNCWEEPGGATGHLLGSSWWHRYIGEKWAWPTEAWK